MFREHYKDFKANLKWLRIKCGVYSGLMLLFVGRLLLCLINIVIKKFTDKTYFTEWVA